MVTYVVGLMESIDIRSDAAVRLLRDFLDVGAEEVAEGGGRAEHFAHGQSCFCSPFQPSFAALTGPSPSHTLRGLLVPALALPRPQAVRRRRPVRLGAVVVPAADLAAVAATGRPRPPPEQGRAVSRPAGVGL
jgi:hypothetical protein